MSTEPEYATCPCGCGTRQDAGLLSAACTEKLERLLAEVSGLVRELDVTLSRQAKIGGAGKSGKGWAHEKLPLNLGAVEAADNLGNVLTTWARDVSGHQWSHSVGAIRVYRNPASRYRGPLCFGHCWHESCGWMTTFDNLPVDPPAMQAATQLLATIDAIRRHPAVNELLDEITDAVQQARRAIDRPSERVYVGPCLVPVEDPENVGGVKECPEDLYARPDAAQAVCRACGITHDVAERRAWLLNQSADMLFTVREAARMIGNNGGIPVTEASIRGYIHRATNPLAYRPGTKLIRLGDLLDILIRQRTEKAA
jgi:hypothetical protein